MELKSELLKGAAHAVEEGNIQQEFLDGLKTSGMNFNLKQHHIILFNCAEEQLFSWNS